MLVRTSLEPFLRGLDRCNVCEADLVGLPCKNECGEIIGKVESVDFKKNYAFIRLDDKYVNNMCKESYKMSFEVN